MAFCFKCGGRLTAEDEFCPGCGTRVNEETAAQAASEPVPVPPAQPMPVMPSPVYMYPAPPPPPPAPLPKPKKPRPAFPAGSKMPMIAGIVMAVWMVLCYFSNYFSPRVGYLRNGGLYVPFALLSVVPVALFLLFAFVLAKKNAKFLLVPWGLHAFFTTPFPVVAYLIVQYYGHYDFAPVASTWIPTLGTLLLSAGAMICYGLTVSNRIRSNILPLILTITVPVWSILCHLTNSSYDALWVVVCDILGALPYILLVAGLKAAPALKSQGEST